MDEPQCSQFIGPILNGPKDLVEREQPQLVPRNVTALCRTPVEVDVVNAVILVIAALVDGECQISDMDAMRVLLVADDDPVPTIERLLDREPAVVPDAESEQLCVVPDRGVVGTSVHLVDLTQDSLDHLDDLT